MAMKIDPEACIDCGACLDPCPNKAVHVGGEPYELAGTSRGALAEKYYIVPERCTECATYYDKPQCVEACPVNCIAPDPERQESRDQLEEKAKRLKAGG